ncbi:MAG: thiolase domain-containing protein [Chloroflexi bacterium]|nr:thiolase domain-containing protein [Chloroflexota bacterium]
MTEVVIAGIGQTPVGEHWELSLRDLAQEAIQAALKDAGGLKPQALFVGNMLAPNLSNQAHLGALVADYSGLTGIETAAFEASGASGASALRQGYFAVASEMAETVLVVGVEKFTDTIGAEIEEALATETDSDFEAMQGVTSAAQAALLMRRYMREYQVPENGFSNFALTAHANGEGNPNAMFRKAITAAAYEGAKKLNEPLNLFDAAPKGDGAAALILTRRELLPSKTVNPPVKIAASAASSDTLALHDRKDMLFFNAAQISAAKALKRAEISLEQIDFFEYHDVFSIYAALQLEAVGFAEKGQGWKFAAEGNIGLKGKLPCATLGGMSARGYTGGASGVYQAVEAVVQIRGQAGKNQIARAKFGLIQSLGGPASTAISHILRQI